MRRKRVMTLGMAILLGVVMLLILKTDFSWNAVPATVDYREGALGIAVVKDMSFLEGKELQKAENNPGVLFEKSQLPYDAENNTLYLSQSLDTQEWVGELSAADNNFFLCTSADEYWGKKQKAIKEGYEFWIWLVGDSSYYKLKLVVSGMPTLSIDTETKEEIQDDQELTGIIRVFNPDVGVDKYEIHESYVAYRIKGGTSRIFDKKGYSMKLQDNKGDRVVSSLLGMRSDNSWKLNALYTDNNRIREKTATQIWEAFCEADPELKQDGAQLEYVELIINNEYLGLYCLVEPVDEDKLTLDKNDILYKVVGWNSPGSSDIAASVAQNANTSASVRINYPKTIVDYAAVWYPMQDYSERFYKDPELDYEKALATVNVENLSDVFMFLMVTTASDNHFKNLYFVAEVTEENEYVMKQIPWDLDYTFGNHYSGEFVNLSVFEAGYDRVYADSTLPRLKFANIEEIGTAFLERWNQYRTSFLSTESILQLLEENRDYVVETGALQREAERWQEVPVSENIDQLLQYQTNRMEWLDSFFVRWATQ